MSNVSMRVVYVYGEPVLIETSGLIFRRNMKDKVIIGESAGADGMATTIATIEATEDEVIAALHEAGFGDFLRGARTMAGMAGRAAGSALKTGAQAAGAAIANGVANASAAGRAAVKATQAAGAVANVRSQVSSAVQALATALSSLSNFAAYANSPELAASPKLHSLIQKMKRDMQSAGMRINNNGVHFPSNDGEWLITAKPLKTNASGKSQLNALKPFVS